MSDTSLTQAGLRARREASIARLCEHFARDHIEADALERLIDQAHQATTVAQLDELFNGLPSLAPTRPAAPAGAPTEMRQMQQNARQLVETWHGAIRSNEMVIAVMGGAERRGVWTPARRMNVSAVMGGVVLDFRQAQLGPGVTEIFVMAIMGGVEIIVPPGIVVDSNGIGIMGGFGHTGRTRYPVDSSVPVLKINGIALMGGVEIRERPSSGWEDPEEKKARKLEKKERERLERGEPADGAGWVDPER